MSRCRPDLLGAIQHLLERTYAIPPVLGDSSTFVVGDRGVRELYRTPGWYEGPSNGSGQGAKTLLREVDGTLRVCVYLPDAMIRRLEAFPPQHGLHDGNVDPFATLVEELDHLVTIAHRAHAGRGVSLFELELHANVSKYLVLARFSVARARPIDPERRAWLMYHLFHKVRFAEDDPDVRRRYEDAVRHAVRFLRAFRALPKARRLQTLRRFHRADASGKVRLVREMAA